MSSYLCQFGKIWCRSPLIGAQFWPDEVRFVQYSHEINIRTHSVLPRPGLTCRCWDCFPSGHCAEDTFRRNLVSAQALARDYNTQWGASMIRKLKSGQYRLYSRKKNPKTGRRRNLGTFKSLAAAKKHERAVQFFKRRG